MTKQGESPRGPAQSKRWRPLAVRENGEAPWTAPVLWRLAVFGSTRWCDYIMLARTGAIEKKGQAENDLAFRLKLSAGGSLF
jgi:hypothetical protein